MFANYTAGIPSFGFNTS